MSEELETHEEALDLWKVLNQRKWAKYAGDANNEKLLLDGAKKYRVCVTAVDRSFSDVRASLVRTDGGNEESDRIDAAQRKVAREAQLDAEVIITDSDYTYAASLSPTQLAEAYQASPEFARKYRKLQREFGFGPVPTLTRASR